MEKVLLGVDAGGTSTRARVCTPSGATLGHGRAGGANLRSAVGDPAANITVAVCAALAAADRRPDAVCVGIAGTEGRQAEVEAIVARALADSGVDLAVPRVVLSDLDIAFRAVSPEPTGSLLLAGTGAVAAGFVDWTLRNRRDGLGWLLGDSGSGVWIGRRVLRAVAAHLDGGPATSMTAPVLTLLDVQPVTSAAARDGDSPAAEPVVDAHDLLRMTDGLPPAAWGRCAPIALTHAADDEQAARIVDEAAAALLTSLAGLADEGAAGPVVLAGGLLASGALRDRIELAVDVAGHAAEPVVGACRIAAASLGLPLPLDVH
ncbi:N-acetylglucosamine kinase-like BadF-type ATPase [Kineosphaera limosa]|uniref:ATPase BadF/BadG/BcrA/BcrD type domain-containing protein n=1 Tax=Kineosphaera limosa NBRC 100340 TaxID=1184609 RepID=K6WAY9_9MICO|nr:BadF/BadG/BcrA/BcrD ATPase family protein [Kineosphaera limosa]NYE00773.1 N-acetylglucosamine kinase-like BadF-type ATPase [Kineosphaera limosa]GAB96385.1 hypothetical protein KILIM_037_00040 [Kineosphaera limosa NBRC 100340]